MGRTRKVGATGKFGARYGMKARKRYAAIDREMRRTHECPSCRMVGVRRVSTGIWRCRKCGAVFAGGAYLPRTSIARDTERVIKSIGAGGSRHV